MDVIKCAKKFSKKYKNSQYLYKYISKNDVNNELVKINTLNIKNLLSTCQNKKPVCFNDFKYKGKFIFSIKSSHVGNLISNFFFQKERMKASMANHPSPIEVWKDDVKRIRLFKGMITLNKKKLEFNESQLRASMRLYFSVVPQFKVSTAKFIYEYFNAKYVLDFCAGWGDRLTAFLSCPKTISYHGIDANKKLQKCYNNLIQHINTNKKIEMIYEPAENVILNTKFDLIFTSPPYFNLEKYSKNKFQSNVKYNNLELWFEKFLFTTLRNNLPLLNGVLVLQISDYKLNNKTIKLIEPLQKFMCQEFPNFKYIGYIGAITKSRFKNVNIEPLFIWKNIK